MRFEYIQYNVDEGKKAQYCRVLNVTIQGYKKYINTLSQPYKYAEILANIEAVIYEDAYNKTYGKQRMYEKLQLDYYCPYCYNTVANVMR